MPVDTFFTALRSTPRTIQFSDTIAVIEACYQFTPTRFRNGDLINEPGQNQGSCKLLSFARLHELTPEETLTCFGQYYQDVLKNPAGSDHQNIRNFMVHGWEGVEFEDEALTPRAEA